MRALGCTRAAVQRVTEECGLEDLPPRMWEEQVIAEIPDKGYWVERHGLFQDIAPGVSLWGFTESAHAQVSAWQPGSPWHQRGIPADCRPHVGRCLSLSIPPPRLADTGGAHVGLAAPEAPPDRPDTELRPVTRRGAAGERGDGQGQQHAGGARRHL